MTAANNPLTTTLTSPFQLLHHHLLSPKFSNRAAASWSAAVLCRFLHSMIHRQMPLQNLRVTPQEWFVIPPIEIHVELHPAARHRAVLRIPLELQDRPAHFVAQPLLPPEHRLVLETRHLD